MKMIYKLQSKLLNLNSQKSKYTNIKSKFYLHVLYKLKVWDASPIPHCYFEKKCGKSSKM